MNKNITRWIVLGIGLLLGAVLPYRGSAQCSVASTGVFSTPTCTAQQANGGTGHTGGLGAGESGNLAATNGVTYSFTWTDNAQSSGICIAGSRYTTQPATYTATATGNVVVGMYRNTTTWAATSAVLNYQKAVPTVTVSPATATSTTQCYNSTITATGAGGSGTFTYAWNNSLSAVASPNVTAAGPQTYTVTATDFGGCTATYVSGSVTVKGAFSAGTIAAATQTICNSTTPAAITYTTNPSGGSTLSYQWYRQTGTVAAPSGNWSIGSWTAVGTSGSTPTLAAATIGTLTTGTYTYALRVTDGGATTCFDVWNGDRQVITVRAAFSAGTIAATTQTICNSTTPAAITYTTSPSGGSTLSYQWYRQTGTVAAPTGTWSIGSWTAVGTSGSTPTLAAATIGTLTTGTYTYALRVTDGGGTTCFDVWNGDRQVITVVGAFSAGTIAATTQTICNSTTPAAITYTTSPSGGSTLAYQWYKQTGTVAAPSGTWSIGSWTAVGSSGSTPTLAAATIGTLTTGTYTYALRVTDGGATTCFDVWNGDRQVITVRAAFSAGVIAATTQTICNGATPAAITYTTSPSGGSTLSYQWYRQTGTVTAPSGTWSLGSWTAVGTSGASPTLAAATIGTLSGAQTYTFALRVTDGGATSCFDVWNGDRQVITVDGAFSAGTIAATTQTICNGATPAAITYTTAPSGGSTLSYQWYKQTGTVAAPSGTWSAGSWSSVGSASASPTLAAATIGTLSGPQTYTYALRVTDAGATTCFDVWNGDRQVITVVGAFTAGTIAAATQTLCSGTTPASITYSTAPSGGSTRSYQWYTQNSSVASPTGTWSLGAWTAIGSSSASPTLAGATIGSLTTGTYTFALRVTDGGATTCFDVWNGDKQVITVVNQPTIASNPSSQTVCTGATVTLTSSATNYVSGGTFSYQWYYNNTTNSNSLGTACTGAGNSGSGLASGATTSYTLPTGNTTTASPGGTGVSGGPFYYYCVFTPSSGTGCNSVTTATAGITVDAQPAVTALSNVSICPGGTATFSTTASGGVSNATGFQWQYFNGTIWVNVTNGTPANVSYSASTVGQTSTLTVTTTSSVATSTSFQYQCVVSFSGNGCTPSVNTNSGILTINPQPSINTQPGTTLMCQGGNGSLTVGVTGGVGASYQWQYFSGTYNPVVDNTPSGITYSGSGGSNPLTLNSSGTSATGTFNYQVIITFSGSGCTTSLTSAAGSALVASPPAIVSQPATTTNVCDGSSASLNIGTSGGIFLTNQWQYYNGSTWNNVVNGTPAGVTYSGTSPLVITTTNGTTPTGSYLYQCIVSSAGSNCNPVTSNPATLVVNPLPTSFTPTLSSNPVCVGSSANVQVASSQIGVNYQLQNVSGPTNVGSPVAGTGSAINLPTGTISASATYQVVATNASTTCSYTSPTVSLVGVSPDMAIGSLITGGYLNFGANGNTTLPTGWTSATNTPSNTNGDHWGLSSANRASAGNYNYYNAIGGFTSASTGAYITIPSAATATTPTVDLITPNINTTGYSNISVYWGAQKSSNYTGTVTFYYSANGGSTWTAVPFTDVQSNVTNDPWNLVNNGVQIKLPSAAANITNLRLKWTANPSTNGSYYSINDIATYGLAKINLCVPANLSVPYLGTSCGIDQYSLSGNVWSGFSAITNATLPAQLNAIPYPTSVAGTYNLDLTMRSSATGLSTTTVNFPVTYDPPITTVFSLENCGCMSGSNYQSVVSVYATGGNGNFSFAPVSGSDALKSTYTGAGVEYSAASNTPGVKGIFWSKADGTAHQYTVSDAQCTTTVTSYTQNGAPSDILFSGASQTPPGLPGQGGGNTISGSYNNSGANSPGISSSKVNGPALSCHQTADFGSVWVTYLAKNMNASTGVANTNDSTNNKAVVEINNYGQDLDSVAVSVYREPYLPSVPNATGAAGNCYQVPEYAMERHYVIQSSKSTGANSFGSNVGVRLYFSDAEYEDLVYWTNYNATANAGTANASCAAAQVVNNTSQLYVTKYTGVNEDGDYTNNNASGLYRIFGANATAAGNGPSSFDGSSGVFGGSLGTNRHYVEFNVREFSEFWLHGSGAIEPLPVEMTFFEAEAINNEYIELNWQTDVEINNKEFQIERSVDGQNWTQIGTVAGHGNSTATINYTYDDHDVAANQRYYYRLKQVDFNLVFKYTGVVTAEIYGNSNFSWNISPNPTYGTTNVIINTTKEQPVTVEVFDVIGQKMAEANSQLTSGYNRIEMDLGHLAGGTYVVSVTSANQVYTRKLVITK